MTVVILGSNPRSHTHEPSSYQSAIPPYSLPFIFYTLLFCLYAHVHLCARTCQSPCAHRGQRATFRDRVCSLLLTLGSLDPAFGSEVWQQGPLPTEMPVHPLFTFCCTCFGFVDLFCWWFCFVLFLFFLRQDYVVLTVLELTI